MGIGMAGAVLTLIHMLPAIVVGLTLGSAGVFIAQAAATSHVGATASEGRGLAIGLYSLCYYVGGSAGGSVPGFLWDAGGWPACVALVIAVQALTIVMAFAFWRGPERGDVGALELSAGA